MCGGGAGPEGAGRDEMPGGAGLGARRLARPPPKPAGVCLELLQQRRRRRSRLRRRSPPLPRSAAAAARGMLLVGSWPRPRPHEPFAGGREPEKPAEGGSQPLHGLPGPPRRCSATMSRDARIWREWAGGAPGFPLPGRQLGLGGRGDGCRRSPLSFLPARLLLWELFSWPPAVLAKDA